MGERGPIKCPAGCDHGLGDVAAGGVGAAGDDPVIGRPDGAAGQGLGAQDLAKRPGPVGFALVVRRIDAPDADLLAADPEGVAIDDVGAADDQVGGAIGLRGQAPDGWVSVATRAKATKAAARGPRR